MPTLPAAPNCIYCHSTGVPFNRDHVIPEAFGLFQNNFVLTSVCEKCNKFFGDELELVLGRNGREAILRLHHGVKAPAGARQLKYDNARLTIGEPGPWRGAQIELAPDPTGTKLDTRPMPQVAFKRKGDQDWYWMPEAKLTDAPAVERYRSSEYIIQVVGPSHADIDRLTAKVKALGIVSWQFAPVGFLVVGRTNVSDRTHAFLFKGTEASHLLWMCQGKYSEGRAPRCAGRG